MKKMEPLDEEFIDMYKQMGQMQGADSLLSSIFGILYLEPEEVSMDELAKKTGYSLASISNNIKTLERVGVVKRIKKPGSRKAYFFIEKNLDLIYL